MVFGKRSATEEEVERALNMEIVVEQKNLYGVVRFYPVNLLAQQFANLMGRMTFDIGHLKRIKEMGISVDVKQEEVVL
jgi:hypothetical protein